MLEDVKLSNECRYPIHFFGRVGGIIPEAQEIVDKVLEIVGGEKHE